MVAVIITMVGQNIKDDHCFFCRLYINIKA